MWPSIWQQIGRPIRSKFRSLDLSLCIKEIQKGDIIDKFILTTASNPLGEIRLNGREVGALGFTLKNVRSIGAKNVVAVAPSLFSRAIAKRLCGSRFEKLRDYST